MTAISSKLSSLRNGFDARECKRCLLVKSITYLHVLSSQGFHLDYGDFALYQFFPSTLLKLFPAVCLRPSRISRFESTSVREPAAF